MGEHPLEGALPFPSDPTRRGVGSAVYLTQLVAVVCPNVLKTVRELYRLFPVVQYVQCVLIAIKHIAL